jgi:PTS system cellobiose-specific IIB component
VYPISFRLQRVVCSIAESEACGGVIIVMIRVLIVCSWGMSTSLLVDSMLAAAVASKHELTVEALSAGEYAARVEECDVVLIAPQIRHLRKSIEKLASSVGKPVALIEPFHYATMNGQAVLEQVLSLLAGSREGKRET